MSTAVKAWVLAAGVLWASGCEQLVGVDDLPTRTCDPASPTFEPRALVYGLNRVPGSENQLHLSPDELTAYLSEGSVPRQTEDIFRTSRASRSEPFGPYVPLAELNSAEDDLGASVTADGLTAFFDSTRSGVIGMFAATRPSTGAPFSPPTHVTLDLEAFEPYASYVLPDGKALYFHLPTGGIFRTPLAGISPGPSVAVPGIGDEWVAQYPVVSPDERVIYFASNQYLPGAHGAYDIWMATRASADEAFGQPVNLVGVNTIGDDVPQWISANGCRLYFAAGTLPEADTMGSFLYVAARPFR